MSEIEATIHLPAGARPLASYARYYAFVTPNEIMGVYMLPHLDDPPGQQCEQINANFSSRPVPCSSPAVERRELSAGGRVWLSDYHHMPTADDGKCGALTLAFNAASHRFDEVSCVGVASNVRPQPSDVRFFERPRAFAAALNSHSPMPVVVLFENHAGPNGPSFALYDDGTVIKASRDGFLTAKLTRDAQDEFVTSLNVAALRRLYGGFRVATSSDQPSEDLLLYVGAKPVFISIYGSLADPLVRANVPRPITTAYTAIKNFDVPEARKWLPRKFPHDELWSSPNNEVR